MPSPSFACVNFISIAHTIGTNYEPNSHKTIGIYAEVLSVQGTAQSSYSLVIPTKPDAGTINTFGRRIFKHLNDVLVWWHAPGTTSLAPIPVAAPNNLSSEFVSLTFVDGTGVDGVGWSQRASSSYLAIIGILLVQSTLTGRRAYIAQSSSVFSLVFRI
jgi:hypothetical protein